jgi:hypothetical protein
MASVATTIRSVDRVGCHLHHVYCVNESIMLITSGAMQNDDRHSEE